MSNLEEAKEEVSEVLGKITNRDEDYFLDGKYCRWGRVERDLWAVLERHLTPLALDEANEPLCVCGKPINRHNGVVCLPESPRLTNR